MMFLIISTSDNSKNNGLLVVIRPPTVTQYDPRDDVVVVIIMPLSGIIRNIEIGKYHPLRPNFADCSEIVIFVSIADLVQFVRNLKK
jgi:hypothetical protein